MTPENNLESLTPTESWQRCNYLIERAGEAADALERLSILPVAPGVKKGYYTFSGRHDRGAGDITLQCMFENGERIDLARFYKSFEINPEKQNRGSGAVIGYPRYVQVRDRREGGDEWVDVLPGSESFQDIEDTISYIESFIHVKETSLLKRMGNAVLRFLADGNGSRSVIHSAEGGDMETIKHFKKRLEDSSPPDWLKDRSSQLKQDDL